MPRYKNMLAFSAYYVIAHRLMASSIILLSPIFSDDVMFDVIGNYSGIKALTTQF